MGHLSVEEFREHAHRAVDWIADYWESLDARPVLAPVAPGEVRRSLPEELPEQPEGFDAVLADLDALVLPGITHWQHPRFFAYFPANSSPAAILGDLISAGIGAQGMIWATSPAVTELEQAVLDQFATALGLPAAFRGDAGLGGGGVISDTASTATFTALLAALHRASGGRARIEGVGADEWTVYGSTQAHSSLLKAVMMAGLGEDALRLVGVDPVTQAMDVAELERMIAKDRARGRTPVLVQAAVGTTSTGAVDDVSAIGRVIGGVIGEANGATNVATDGVANRVAPAPWLHVDAAWAGVAAICPEHRGLVAGVGEYADSFVTNPHKWMLTTFDCSTLWVRDAAALTGALTILPEYLRNAASESGAVVDYRDWHPQLGRRFRSLKLWTVLRCYGLEGVREHIRSGVAMAEEFADMVRADDRFEILTEPVLGLVVFALRAGDGDGDGDGDGNGDGDGDVDGATMALMEAVNASGLAYLSHTRVEGRAAIRMAIGSWRTGPDDVAATWAALQEAAPA